MSNNETEKRSATRVIRWLIIALLAGTPASRAGNTGTDSAHTYVWAENVGWANFEPANHEVTVHYNEESGGWLSGHVWGENIGWIAMGSAAGGSYANTTSNNWGVNLAANGDLSGYAWGENVGWINFGAAQCDAAINVTNGEFSGHAWGENIGWISFNSANHGVRTLAFDRQGQGTPNWWLAHHGVSEGYDAGDGVPAWQKYVMDVSPTNVGNGLTITTITNGGTTRISFAPVSQRRLYTLVRKTNLSVVASWEPVPGQIRIAGSDHPEALSDTNAGSSTLFAIEVEE